MGLFKKVNCAECGKQFGGILKTKLADSRYLCSNCTDSVPPYMYKSFFDSYTLDEFRTLKQYIEYSERELRPLFSETDSYYSIHIDAVNELFYLGKKITEDTIFFKFSNVDNFDLDFNAKELKAGILGDKVTGDILFELSMTLPRFDHETKLATDVKTTAKKNLFGTKITYDSPADMSEFYAHFRTLWILSADDDCEGADESTSDSSPLQQAMALFMLDSLENVTLNDVTVMRDCLMSVFHPDKQSDSDAAFGQKINEAYDELKKHLM